MVQSATNTPQTLIMTTEVLFKLDVKKVVTILAGLLGLIHGLIGLTEQLLRINDVFLRVKSDPQTC